MTAQRRRDLKMYQTKESKCDRLYIKICIVSLHREILRIEMRKAETRIRALDEGKVGKEGYRDRS